jgi:hypothetical protein
MKGVGVAAGELQRGTEGVADGEAEEGAAGAVEGGGGEVGGGRQRERPWSG